MGTDRCWIEESGEIPKEAYDALAQHTPKACVTVFEMEANEIWKTVIGVMDKPTLEQFYRWVLKTRKKGIEFGINGHMVNVKRSIIRDYLKRMV